MKHKVGIGVIGVGGIGRYHIQRYLSNPKAELVAVADGKADLAESIGRKHNIKYFDNHYDLLGSEKIEAVSVCTPPYAHSTITCDAAKHGKHVLCEKPMAMNAEQSLQMVNECEKNKVKLGICSSRIRLTTAVENAKKYVDTGKLGKIYYVKATMIRRRGRPGCSAARRALKSGPGRHCAVPPAASPPGACGSQPGWHS